MAVFTAADLGDPYLLATLEREEFVPTPMPLLAGDQVRFAASRWRWSSPTTPTWPRTPRSWWRSSGRRARGDRPRHRAGAGARQVHQETGNCLVDLLMFDDERLAGIFAARP